MKKPSEYFGDAAPQTVGRTRLLRGVEPVSEPVEPAPIPAQTASPVEPFHRKDAAKWRKKRAKGQESAAKVAVPAPPPATRALRDRTTAQDWRPGEPCPGCGGKPAVTAAGTGQDANCPCGLSWISRRGCGWRRA